MNRRMIEGLKELGITKERFYSDVAGFMVDDPYHSAPAWGITLYKNGRVLAVVSHTPRAHGGDGRYYIRKLGQFKNTPELPSGKLQREAVRKVLQELYHISDAEMAEHRARERRASMRAV